jgi:hypothetical protein
MAATLLLRNVLLLLAILFSYRAGRRKGLSGGDEPQLWGRDFYCGSWPRLGIEI